MGEVYLAKDNKLGRRVALKILPEQFAADPERINRFVREARAASALNHPNIITIHEVGEDGGTNYIATEFIDGKTLRERLFEKPLSFEEAMSVAVQTTEALAAAHTAGIVHRDIKPENIMIRTDGYVKVLDFGIAKLTEDALTESIGGDTRKLMTTETGVVIGTAKYISPEQAYGKPVDSRSDIFSFGVVLYEMLAGRRPFDGETPLDAIASIVYQDPHPLKDLVSDLPAELERIVSKTLRKNRDERYQTSKELLADLKYFREQLARDARLATSPTNYGTAVSTPAKVSTPSTGQKDAILLTDFENLTGESVFDATLKTALTYSLIQSPFLNILSDTRVRQMLRLMGKPPETRIGKDLGREVCIRLGSKAYISGTIASIGSTYLITLEAFNSRSGESIACQLEQAESKEHVIKSLGEAAVGLRQKLGESLGSIEQFDAALENTTGSLEALKVYTIGHNFFLKGKSLEAVPFYKEAIELDPRFEAALTGLATYYANTNQWKLAAEYIARAFELRKDLSEYERLRVTYCYHNFATGDIDEQVAALELWIETYPKHAIPYIALGDCYEKIGQSAKAVAVAQKSIRIDSSISMAHANLAESLLSLGNWAEVTDTCQRAFEKGFDGESFHAFLFKAAFAEGNEDAINEQLGWFNGRNDEYIALDLKASAEAFRGRWRKSQTLSKRSVELAARCGANEVAAQYAAEQALRIVFWSSDSGFPSPSDEKLQAAVRTQTNNALRLERGWLTISLAAFALAAAGLVDEAKRLCSELRRDYPEHTLINALWLPLTRAAGRLLAGRPREAIDELQAAERTEKAGRYFPQYLRGHAFLRSKEIPAAAAEFDKILNSRGEAPLSSIYPLAQLGKARATRSKEEYDKFFELWKDADEDMPALVKARKEN